jgi:hypothetical protein
MQLARLTPCVFFSIRSYRYHDRKVLMKASKVGTHNKIVFSDCPSMGGEPYYVSGVVVKQCPKEKMKTKAGGDILMYAVPVDSLEKLELVKDLREVL